MRTVGPGAQEIGVSDEAGIFRVIYVAKFEETVYVLHCFQKKTQRTSRTDIDIAKSRYGTLVEQIERRRAEERKGKRK
jgi:phage-related protein